MITLTRAKAPHKWTATFPNGKRVSFGASGYEDYTTHHDAERMNRYLKRHKTTENWNDPYTAGYWARWLLWNKPTLTEAIKDIEKRLKMKIKIN
jgi:hypothetical protein